MNEIPFSFDDFEAKPVDGRNEVYQHDAKPMVGQPPAAEDSSEYLCGNAGNAHPYANPGRDQDRSRMDERIPASPFARYVS